METREKEIEIYKNIDFYNRFEKLSKDFFFNDTFEKYSNDEVLKIIEELGYKAKYNKKENFFRIEEKIANVRVGLNICLKYGLAELILGASDIKKDKYLAGSVFGNMAKRMEAAIGKEREGFIPKPRFRNYEDLKGILKVAVGIYEDFKQEIVREFGGK